MKAKYLMYWMLGRGFVLFKPVLDFNLRRRSPKLYRFYNIENELKKIYQQGELEKAESLAFEYLDLAVQFNGDWNYGNAVHASNRILGLIHLRRGNIEKAKEHLLLAGHTPGSPQLDSFGPSLNLARELLERGEKDVVLEYLDLVSKFWLKDDLPEFHDHVLKKQEIMEHWKTAVKEGQVPNDPQWN